MTFNHFIKRHTKGVLIFIALTMIVPLVLWGSYGQGTSDPEAEKVAGTFLNGLGETVTVSRRDYLLAREKAKATYWWRELRRNPYAFFGNRQQPPAQELHKLAWDGIILLEDANVKGITVRRKDRLDTVDSLFRFASRFDRSRQQYSDAFFYKRLGPTVFQTPERTFQMWVEDQVVREKLMNLVGEGTFAEYGRVYEEVVSENQEARVWVAGFDPEEYRPSVRPVVAEEVAAYYGNNTTRYQVAEKIQVSYLMVDLEKLKAKVADPSDDDVNKHYALIKDEFLKPHEHGPGEVHRADEAPQHKPLEEVRAEVVEKWKTMQARAEALKIMTGVNEALGSEALNLLDKKKNEYRSDAFEQLRSHFSRKKIELVHDITSLFDRDGVAEVEKLVGENSNLAVWGFDPEAKEGKISDAAVTTSKAVALFRLEKKKASYPSGVTELVRRRIVKELRKEQLRNRAKVAAENLKRTINALGFASARSQYRNGWTRTGYFKVNGGQTGIEDWALSSEITRRIRGRELKTGKATVVAGDRSGSPGKEGWSHLVFLEDTKRGEPDDFQTAFNSVRSRLDGQEQARYRDKYALEVRAASELQDIFGAEENPIPKSPTPAPPTP